MRTLVTHPGRQHSHQLALALHDRGALAGYWTGVPAAAPATKGPGYRLLARLSPQPTLPLPARRVRHNYVMPLVRRVAERVLAPAQALDWRHRAAGWFDAWAARRLPAELDAVVAYENAALDTFRSARAQGTPTILDAASFHHAWQDAFFDPVETDAVHRRINARKDAEIEQADHILTVSDYARESYIDAGVPPEQVTAVAMGADLSAFVPSDVRSRPAAQESPFTLIFAGHASRRKGVDTLLQASSALAPTHDHRLLFAGGWDDRLPSPDAVDAPVERLGYLDRPALADAFRRADLLVLPSRHDSFGRVVVEAMATGLPALVSDHVGAKELVDEGTTGWIAPAEDADALAARMRWCIEHADAVRALHDAAAERAQDYSWTAYRERVVDVIASIAGTPVPQPS